MDNVKYRAVSYIRVAFADKRTGENTESEGVATQRSLIKGWLEGYPDIEVIAEMVDDGVSGLSLDRPAFKDMLRLIEQGEINCVISSDLNRLGRGLHIQKHCLHRIFSAYGIRYIAVFNGYDSLTGDYLTKDKTLQEALLTLSR